MSQARLMTAALNRHIAALKAHTDPLPLEEKVEVYLATIRENEGRRDGLHPAMTASAQSAILKLYDAGTLYALPSKVMTQEERAKCFYRGKGSLVRSAFIKWFNTVRKPGIVKVNSQEKAD